jgi:hypothetical protein
MAVLLRRRSLLSAGLLTVLTACGGTTGRPAAPAPVDPDTAARRRLGTAMATLLAAYDNSRQATPDLQRLLAAELTAVDPGATKAVTAAKATGSSSEEESSSTASPSVRPSTAATAAAPVSNAMLGARESALATQCATELCAVSPALARLLASVAAGAAQRAVVLGTQPPATTDAAPASAPASTSGGPRPSAAELSSLQAALGAEDAAVYGYGVIGAQLSGSDRDRASTDFALHRDRRDALSAQITAAGARPQAAAAAYVLPFEVTDAGSARRLATLLEVRLAAVYANGVQAATGTLRAEAATELRAAALRSLSWGGSPAAFPGLPEQTSAA